MQATLVAVKGGWHAVGDGWAVFGETEEQALERYQEAEQRHAEILSRSVGGLSDRGVLSELPAPDLRDPP